MHLRQWQGNEMIEIETRGTIPASACMSSTSASFINCTYRAWKAWSWGVHSAAGQGEGSVVFGGGMEWGKLCAVNLHISSCISEWSWDARDSSGKHKNFTILIFTSSFYASDSNLSDYSPWLFQGELYWNHFNYISDFFEDRTGTLRESIVFYLKPFKAIQN